MIQSLTISGFMGIPPASPQAPAQTLRLGRLTVLVGANGAGKTTLLRALAYLPKLLSAGSASVLNPEKHLILHKSAQHHNRESPLEVRYVFDWPQAGQAVQGGLTVSCRGVPYNFSSHVTMDGEVEKLSASFLQKKWLRAKDSFGSGQIYHLSARSIQRPYKLGDTGIKESGRGILGALLYLKLNDPDRARVIEEGVAAIIPGFERVRFVQVALENTPTFKMLIDTEQASGIFAEAVSEGTLLVIGLMTLLHSDPAPNLLLMDNLDQGLHPLAQEDLVSSLRKLMEVNPNLQVVATTHSPYLVDHLAPEEVIVCAYDSARATPVYKPLVSHPDYGKWRERLKLGEFWSYVGEDWAAGEGGEGGGDAAGERGQE